MTRYPEGDWERAMKVQEVILRAMAKKITWWQAAEIIGLSDRSLRRWRWRYAQYGSAGLFDRRRGQPTPGGCRRWDGHWRSRARSMRSAFRPTTAWSGTSRRC